MTCGLTDHISNDANLAQVQLTVKSLSLYLVIAQIAASFRYQSIMVAEPIDTMAAAIAELTERFNVVEGSLNTVTGSIAEIMDRMSKFEEEQQSDINRFEGLTSDIDLKIEKLSNIIDKKGEVFKTGFEDSNKAVQQVISDLASNWNSKSSRLERSWMLPRRRAAF